MTDVLGVPAPKEPWDRQDGETDKAYRAFEWYLHLGPLRSLEKWG